MITAYGVGLVKNNGTTIMTTHNIRVFLGTASHPSRPSQPKER
jgi:hypothetical protein